HRDTLPEPVGAGKGLRVVDHPAGNPRDLHLAWTYPGGEDDMVERRQLLHVRRTAQVEVHPEPGQLVLEIAHSLAEVLLPRNHRDQYDLPADAAPGLVQVHLGALDGSGSCGLHPGRSATDHGDPAPTGIATKTPGAPVSTSSGPIAISSSTTPSGITSTRAVVRPGSCAVVHTVHLRRSRKLQLPARPGIDQTGDRLLPQRPVDAGLIAA